MITFQKQGHNECQLATTAMLTGLPLKTIKKEAMAIGRSILEEQHSRRVSVTGNTESRVRPLKRWVSVFRLRLFWPIMNTLHASHGVPLAPSCTYHSGKLFEALACNHVDGRGQLTIGFYRLARRSPRWARMAWYAHAVAFENGTIFDPDTRGPMCLMDWKVYQAGLLRKGMKFTIQGEF